MNHKRRNTKTIEKGSKVVDRYLELIIEDTIASYSSLYKEGVTLSYSSLYKEEVTFLAYDREFRLCYS